MIRYLRTRLSRTLIAPPGGAQGDGAAPQLPAPPTEELPEMAFLDHLEDLRWSLLKGLLSLIVVTFVASFFSKWIIDRVLLGPTHADFFMYRIFGIEAVNVQLQSRNPTGQFFAHLGTIVSVGLVLGSPLLVYFIWKFIEPGLYRHEKSGMRFAALFATVFFALGLSFGYLIVTPLALQFFAQYTISPQIVNEFDITKYFSMVTSWTFSVGVIFELPVVMYFLAKMGVVNGESLRAMRKYALIIALVLGAILTPPDPLSQVLVAAPLLLLFELSIHIATHVDRRRQRELARALE